MPPHSSDPSTLSQLLILIALLAAFVVFVYATQIVYAARQGIQWKVRVLSKSILWSLMAFAVMKALGGSFIETVAIAIAVGLIASYSVPKRSRYIPRKELQAAKRHFERETGRKYNSKEHHLDHIMPFARGGSHTADNLRVIEKKKNLRKGKRMPRLGDFGDLETPPVSRRRN